MLVSALRDEPFLEFFKCDCSGEDGGVSGTLAGNRLLPAICSIGRALITSLIALNAIEDNT